MNLHPSHACPDCAGERGQSSDTTRGRQDFQAPAHPQPGPKKILGLWTAGGLFHDRFAAMLRDHFVENPGR